jgi:hypothetical protein
MKPESLNAFRKIIREEVQKAIQEEVRDIILDAVIIASTPKSASAPVQANENFRALTILSPNGTGTGTTVNSLLTTGTSTDTVKTDIRAKFQAMNPIEQMLEETKLNFTSADAKNFSGNIQNKAGAMAHELGMMSDGPHPGLDLSSLPFLNKAKSILDVSKQKDRERHGGN